MRQIRPGILISYFGAHAHDNHQHLLSQLGNCVYTKCYTKIYVYPVNKHISTQCWPVYLLCLWLNAKVFVAPALDTHYHLYHSLDDKYPSSNDLLAQMLPRRSGP